MKNMSLLILGALMGALITYYFCSSTLIFEETITKPMGIITPEEAKTLDLAFNTRHQLISDQIVMRPDNRSAWWSLEDLRNYLKYAENQSHELGYRMDGVRLYLGAYPDTNEEGVGYTTMFFVPTGMQALSEGSSMPFHFKRQGGDIPGGDGLNVGSAGDPPSANYPQ